MPFPFVKYLWDAGLYDALVDGWESVNFGLVNQLSVIDFLRSFTLLWCKLHVKEDNNISRFICVTRRHEVQKA